MAGPYYCKSGGSDAADGLTWANAFATLKKLTDTVAAGERGFYAGGSLHGADTTFTLAGTADSLVQIFCTTDTVNEPPTSIAAVALTETAAGVDLTFTGSAYVYGLDLTTGSGGTQANIVLGIGDDTIQFWENCSFNLASTASTSIVRLGEAALRNAKVTTIGCDFTFASVNQGIEHGNCVWDDFNSRFAPTGSVPTNLIESVSGTANWNCCGSDFSTCSGNIIGDATTVGYYQVNWYNCDYHESAVFLVAQTNEAHTEFTMHDCHSGDTHYNYYHENAKGKTEINTTIYMNSGATHDGSTGNYSWKITGTAAATLFAPYYSPWIAAYNTDVSTSITPRLECVRDGSATKYNDDELWGEFMAKVTTGSVISTMTSDRRGLVAAAAAQASSSLGASDWTGENATAVFMKLEPAAFTPAEVGYIMARVAIVGANVAYVNPKILGISTTTNVNTERVTPFGWMQSNLAAASGGLAANPLRGFLS